MKVFSGQLETMTCREMREKLREYPDDMPVLATWEGVEITITPEEFKVAPTCLDNPDDKEPCLIIDVNEYYY